MNNTVNRASLGAKKNKLFKSGFCEKLKLLLIPIGLLMGSITMQVWGYSPVYLNGDFTGGNWGTNGDGSQTYQVNYELDGSNSGHYFLPFYTSSGDKYWRFCENNGSAYLNCPATDNYEMNVGTAAYQIEGGHKYNFKSTVDAGIIAVHIHQNYDGKGKSANGTNDRPRVWLERPTIYIWHNWDGNDANWNQNKNACQRAMNDNEDGTYTYDGTYSGSATGTCVGIEGSDAIKKYFSDGDATKVGSPSAGDKCRFKWDASGDFESGQYFGYGTSEQRRGASLTITKFLTITYHGNGNEGGSAPSNEEVLYNTATATYTNTGNMTKTNYAFIGWNTQADGRGTHYDAGANITLTTDKDLYAEWVPCWVLRGGNSGSSDGSDAMGDWTPQEMTIIGTNAFMIELTLAANTTYYFKIADRHNGKKADYSTYTHYGCNGTMTTTTLDWAFYTSHGNCQLTTGASGGGTWRFAWNASSKYLCVYAPADAPKSSFAQGKYIYFDARANSTWKTSEFKAKFWFKNLASGADDGDISCLHTAALDDWVYYALVPANKTWGSVQMNSRNASTDAFNYDANTIYARDRTSANQNCMVTPSSGESGITLTWGNYCPPMSSATLSDNSTNKISWQDAGNDGSASGKAILVSTSKTIEVSGAATKALDDTNMTINYDFKVDGSSAQAGSSNTYSKGSLSNNMTYTITMDAYNTYNGATGTKLTAGQTLYYKALDTYSVTNTLTNISSDGRSGSDAAANNIAYTATLSVGTGYNLPATITVKCGETTLTASTHYTYNSSTGALSINAAQVTGNITIIAAGVAKTYTEADNLDKNGGDAHGEYTATYDATKIAINTTPTKANYHVEGYYLEADCTNKIADAAGNLVSNVTKDAVTYTDGTGKWKQDASVKLYTKWEENSFTVTVNAGTHGTVSTPSVTGHPITASSNFTVTANAGYAFSHWTFSEEDKVTANYVSTGGTNNATQTFNIKATKAITMTANYVVRYGLYGSLDNVDGGNEYGMPGWGVSADFEYSADSYTITRDLTKPNANYKFRVLDRRNNFSYGCSENYTYAKNDETLTLNSGNYNAYIGTAGRGSYTFTITEVSSGAYPAIQITSHPESYLVTLGVKSVLIDGTDAGELGGTVTATDDAGNTYTSGQYIANGETVTVEATDIPTGYHFVGWWSSSAYSGEPFATINPKSWSVVEPVNAYAKFTEDSKEAETGDGSWSAKVGASTLTDVVIISSTITVDVDHALAKRVILDQSGGGKAGKLVIAANKGLEVAEGIWINNGTSLVAPTAEDLVLKSSSSGNATLIFNNSNSAAATVQMYSKASVAGSTWNWQYMASPYVTASALHNYYGSYLYRWGNGEDETTGWFAVPNGGSVVPFVAYCITNKTAGTYYQMDGTMVATDGNDQTISVPAGKSWVVGNSWTAPIQIGQLQNADFEGLLKNVYLYNTGMDVNGEADMAENPTGDDRYAANTYVSIPIHAAPYSGISVVSSLQGFYVKDDPSVAGGGTLKLNYTNHVRPSDGYSIQNGAMHAPKRIVAEDNEPNVLKIKVCGSKYDDRLVLLERADFSMGYDAGWDGDKMGNVAASPRITVEREDGTSDAVSAVPDLEGLAINFRAANTDNQQTLYFEYSDDINPLYIVDVTNNEYTRVLTGNSYTFSTSDNEEHPRFILTRYGAPQITTGVDEVYNANSARKQMINGTLYIIRDGRIYNAEGALVK